MRTRILACLFGLGAGWPPGAALAQATAGSGLADELAAGFYTRINVLSYGLGQDLSASPLNDGNRLGVPDRQAEVLLRPDFNLKWRALELDFKPRFDAVRARIAGMPPDTAPAYLSGSKEYVNEGSLRVRPHERLTLSYGRENLQWGPSALLSPSNPFNADNGRNNPNLELPGLDYARAVWVAGPALTVSAIANTGRGRLDAGARYRKARALKVDYTGDTTFASLIASKADGEHARIGGFAGWNVTDAFSLRAEGSAGKGTYGDASAVTAAAAPRFDPAGISLGGALGGTVGSGTGALGGSLAGTLGDPAAASAPGTLGGSLSGSIGGALNGWLNGWISGLPLGWLQAYGAGSPDRRRDRQLLVGASYTLESGATLSADYFFNKDGCVGVPIQVCLARRGALVDPLRPLARRRYALLQYVDTKVGGNMNLYLRLIRNLDDRSSQLVLNVEYELGQHWQLYLIPTFYRGGPESEFGSVLKRSLFVGASYTF